MHVAFLSKNINLATGTIGAGRVRQYRYTGLWSCHGLRYRKTRLIFNHKFQEKIFGSDGFRS